MSQIGRQVAIARQQTLIHGSSTNMHLVQSFQALSPSVTVMLSKVVYLRIIVFLILHVYVVVFLALGQVRLALPFFIHMCFVRSPDVFKQCRAYPVILWIQKEENSPTFKQQRRSQTGYRSLSRERQCVCVAVWGRIVPRNSWQQSTVLMCPENDGQDVKGRHTNVSDQLYK